MYNPDNLNDALTEEKVKDFLEHVGSLNGIALCASWYPTQTTDPLFDKNGICYMQIKPSMTAPEIGHKSMLGMVNAFLEIYNCKVVPMTSEEIEAKNNHEQH